MRTKGRPDIYEVVVRLMNESLARERKQERNQRQAKNTRVTSLQEYLSALSAQPEVLKLVADKQAAGKRRLFGRKFSGKFTFYGLQPASLAKDDSISDTTLSSIQESLNSVLVPLGLTVKRLTPYLSGWTRVSGKNFQNWDFTAHVE